MYNVCNNWGYLDLYTCIYGFDGAYLGILLILIYIQWYILNVLPVVCVPGEVETEEVVPVMEVGARQAVPLVL